MGNFFRLFITISKEAAAILTDTRSYSFDIDDANVRVVISISAKLSTCFV